VPVSAITASGNIMVVDSARTDPSPKTRAQNFHRDAANWLPHPDFSASVSARATRRLSARRRRRRVGGFTANNATAFRGVQVA
jgi:hypothetical protein